eukprot:CAMPEP_0116823932 /NCGR_PEP_ID=MMETSP0418-20121206/1115_1 /TAXON_ID=1158023 /ORGANISM="Astrosyne radiata, Strain 13vi08-1A" /LENGTH=214 /DNA_ID=CAMNT_0004452245 /DNA_START=440 /DNA_END=1084 /DNA_ORIENTATION=+
MSQAKDSSSAQHLRSLLEKRLAEVFPRVLGDDDGGACVVHQEAKCALRMPKKSVEEVEVSIRGDNAAIILSTVVYKMPQKRPLMNSAPSLKGVTTDCSVPPPPPLEDDDDASLWSPRSYSMMTRMMKINTGLQEEEHGGRICMYGSRFILFQTLPVVLLEDYPLEFEDAISDFIAKAQYVTSDLKAFAGANVRSPSRKSPLTARRKSLEYSLPA